MFLKRIFPISLLLFLTNNANALPVMQGPLLDNGSPAYPVVLLHAKYYDSSGRATSTFQLLINNVSVGETSAPGIENAIVYNGMKYYLPFSMPYVELGQVENYWIQGGFCADYNGQSCGVVYDLYRVDSAPASSGGTTTPPVTTPPVTTPPVTQPETPAPTLIYPTVPTVTLNAPRAEKCSEGYTGRIQYKWEIYYTNDVYSTTYSDGTPATVTQSTPHQREVLDYNSCTLIPTQNTQAKSGVQEQTCDSYYGTSSGTYYGSVYKYGTYNSTYNSGSKSTSTAFTTSSIDTTSCVAQYTNMTMESKIDSCPSGQYGSITSYKYVATDTKGATVYPYGNTWFMGNNSCANMQIASDNSDTTEATPSGLLSNISITSSSLHTTSKFENYLKSLKANSWASNENHKLIINVEDLSSGQYNSDVIGSAVSNFKQIVGSQNSSVEIKLPKTIDKFIGIDQITETNVNSGRISLKSVDFENGNAVIKYFDLGVESTEQPKELVSTINIIPNNVNLTGVSGS